MEKEKLMPPKLKPSNKRYLRDKNGKQTNSWVWEHHTVGSYSTKELKELYTTPSYRKKKNIIKRELQKRNAFE